MIVSILQLVGLPLGAAASRSRGENPNRERPAGNNQGITRSHDGDPSAEKGRSATVREEHARAAAARRQEVKPQTKAGKPAAKAKPAAKPAVKAPAKKAPVKPAHPAAKKSAPPPKAKPAAKAAAATKPHAAPAKTPAKAKPAAGAALPRAMPPRPDAATLGAEPARATKPSARLAQITVPSMAQSVASTAAKASYTQTMSPSVLTPPPLV